MTELDEILNAIDQRIEVLKSKDKDAKEDNNQLRRSREAYLSRADELEMLKKNLSKMFS